ncbi:acyl-CoA reductase [Armatimonas sp.]|uniref:acyl-CoA reductase n=1 Tax=Armatimonas sp. TaxID=1872638 RepID=UPI00286CDFB5|nr:acyl-CoA reductase [Armatimonas sp.]
METTPQTVREALAKLRELPPIPVERRLAALEKFWQQVCLAPPEPTPAPFVPHFADPPLVQGRVDTSGASSRVGSGGFPWVQVHQGIEALARSAPPCSEPENMETPGVLALILAGNTPLLAWPVLHYAVLLGIPVFIKQSRDEVIWTRHFVETLAEIDPEVAVFLHLDLFPGDDPRTHVLIQNTDAVIAYGSDETIATLREATPKATPFQGFGHALSIGIWTGEDSFTEFNDSLTLAVKVTLGFAQDFLVYDQAGCLSLQAIFMQKSWIDAMREMLACEMPSVVHQLSLPLPTDPAECSVVREARDLALMQGCEVLGDSELRWTLVIHPDQCALPSLMGHRVLHLIPLEKLTEFGNYLGIAKGRLSSVGVGCELSSELEMAIKAEGVSRICQAGEMQTPPLDWRNGGVDLRAWLVKSLAS